ncbi:MAG: glycosyltransferase family 2 protein [Deltaproteobacteria bacterium]|jgi:glycosyltransferase involved in cell wall biosynthesis|nr:glycosyltransferase family 2 protein [Deltaproteobacteria bacterium]MBW2382769.1 glycosyltransferase family 2 protein [Deltaproteobacteria bacterium]MBW2695388.1 glycosyltransferase family 2 protein [Deltaproteobacteria bacterium]
MSAGLSACVIACNEEQELARCLDAIVDLVDEVVVVVDASSLDGTEKIARERAQRVVVRPYAGDIEQKRHAVGLATHDWVLVIDPDEVVPGECALELRDALQGADDALAGIELNRITRHLGRWIRHGDFFPDWTLRVFRRSRAHWEGTNPHGRVVVEGRVARMATPIQHYSYRDLADQVDRIQRFSAAAAVALHERGRPARVRDLVLRPPARFLRAYVQKRGFLDGVPGLVIAAATAFHVFLKYAKLWELERVKNDCP